MVFVVVILLVSVAALLLRLHELDRFYNGTARAKGFRWEAALMVGVLLAAVVAMGVLLVWARMDMC